MIKRSKPLRRGKPPTKKTSARKQKQKQELDLLVKAKILERDGHQCVRCGATQNLQAAHIMPKGTYQRMRWMELNLLTLCLKDHLFFAHKDPMGFAKWLNEKYPGRYEELLIWSRQMPKIDMKQLKIELSYAD